MDGFPSVEHGLERPRFNFRTREDSGIDVVQSDRDDLLLLADVQSIKRLVVGETRFERDAPKPFISIEVGGEALYGSLRSCKKEVDAFRRQQHRSLQPNVSAHAPQHRLQSDEVVEGDKPVPSDVGNVARHISACNRNFLRAPSSFQRRQS